MLEKGSVEACQVEQIIHSVTSSSSPVSSLWLRFSTSSEDAYHRQFIEITILLQAFIKKHSQNLHPNHYYLQVLLLKRILWRGNLHKNHFVTNLLDKQCTPYNSINSFFQDIKLALCQMIGQSATGQVCFVYYLHSDQHHRSWMMDVKYAQNLIVDEISGPRNLQPQRKGTSL